MLFTIDSNEKKNDLGSLTLKEYKGLLKLPAGAMVLVSVTCNVTADAFILIALSEHLVQFHLTPMMVGSIYLCLFLSYGLSSPLAGKIGDKMVIHFFSLPSFSFSFFFQRISKFLVKVTWKSQ
ncbi:MFS-type transporter SLC18B1 [Trichonephila inaurata madagascariensis]|uniref:MFS-type transporter SLC18B1 n=1 Tax=Trichonephila inaurata madagascariensis TaxID=2747483 RepID=A0A8X6WPJ5_9ARAC|nr:MFS-type transporter SLC18B1 [Trichonephila inaurata madagascariensis]